MEKLKGVRACDGSLCVCGEQEGEMFGSRYSDQFSCSLFSSGKQEISLSSTPSGQDGEGVAIARVSDRGRFQDIYVTSVFSLYLV